MIKDIPPKKSTRDPRVDGDSSRSALCSLAIGFPSEDTSRAFESRVGIAQSPCWPHLDRIKKRLTRRDSEKGREERGNRTGTVMPLPRS